MEGQKVGKVLFIGCMDGWNRVTSTGLGTFSLAALLTTVDPPLLLFDFCFFHWCPTSTYYSTSTVCLFAVSRNSLCAAPHLLFVMNRMMLLDLEIPRWSLCK